MGARWRPSSAAAAAAASLIEVSSQKVRNLHAQVTITSLGDDPFIHDILRFHSRRISLSSKAFIASLKHHQGSLNVLHTHFASAHNQVHTPIQTIFFSIQPYLFISFSHIYIYSFTHTGAFTSASLVLTPMYQCISSRLLFVLIVESDRSCLPGMFSRVPQLYIASYR